MDNDLWQGVQTHKAMFGSRVRHQDVDLSFFCKGRRLPMGEMLGSMPCFGAQTSRSTKLGTGFGIIGADITVKAALDEFSLPSRSCPCD